MNISEFLITQWVETFMEWYIQTFMVLISPEMIFIQIELLVAIYLILQVLELFFPLIKRITILIFLPFRVLHIWLHLHTIHKLDHSNSGRNDYLIIKHSLEGLTGKYQYSLEIGASNKNIRDIYRIAMSPTRAAIFISILSFILSPVLILFGIIGFFIHLYVLLGSITTLWSDLNDYFLVYQVALLNSDLSLRYLFCIIPIFLTTSLGTFVISKNLLNCLLSGMSAIFIYFSGLIWLVSRNLGEKPDLTSEYSIPIIEVIDCSLLPELVLNSEKKSSQS